MPPTMVHCNGSVNLADAETVMRELTSRIPALRRVPDGETGDRKVWLTFQSPKFQSAKGLEPAAKAPSGETVSEMDEAKVRITGGVDPAAIQWPDLSYCSYYLASFEAFRKLQDEGLVAAGVRFQASYGTPLAAVTTYVRREDVLRVEPSYEQALFTDLDKLLATVPHDRIAVQWDLPLEIGVLELPEFFAVSESQTFETIIGGVVRCIDQVPQDVPVGLHMCYGDYQHRHWKEPESLATQVRLLNGVVTAAKRDVSWCSFTVPQCASEAAYFSPLADLQSADTELYLSLVPYHPDEQQDGTLEEQIALVDKYIGSREWGICTECGMANVARDELPALLGLHTKILSSAG